MCGSDAPLAAPFMGRVPTPHGFQSPMAVPLGGRPPAPSAGGGAVFDLTATC